MTYTDCGKKVSRDWMPLALANGIAWGQQRKGQPDRFRCCLYRHGRLNKLLWWAGNLIALWVKL